jgi:hypothetical protein
MDQLRKRGVLAALLLVESCWVFLLLGLIGSAMGNFGPLLSWPGILLILSIAAMTQWWAPRMKLPDEWIRTTAVIIAAVLLYTTMTVHFGGLLWFNQLGEPGRDAVAVPRMVLGLLASIFLWWRGVQLAGQESHGETLWWEFPIGLVLLVLVAIIEATSETHLSGGPVTFVFFGAVLAGLALEHLEQSQDSLSRWAQTLGWVIGFILLLGYLTTLMSASAFSELALALFTLFGWVARMVLAILFVPFGIVLELFFSVFNALWNWFFSNRELDFPELQNFDPRELLERVEEREGNSSVLITVIKWVGGVLLAVSLLGLLYWALWLRLRAGIDRSSMVRESVKEETSLEDLGTLLASLLPRWRARERPHMYALPPGEDHESRVRRAYYQLLNAATVRGTPRQAWETPLQFEPRLAQQFTGLPAHDVTKSFERVRFGLLRPSAQETYWLENVVKVALGDSTKEERKP